MTGYTDIHSQVSAWTHVFISFGGQEGAKLLCNRVILCLNLSKASRQFSKAAVPPSTLPLVTYEGFGFSISSAMLATICLLREPHPDGLSGISLRFDLHLPDGKRHGASFYVFFGYVYLWS